MNRKINATVLVSAYSCCPGRGSEPRCGWNYVLQYAQRFERVILVTSIEDWRTVERELGRLGVENVKIVAVALPFGQEKLRTSPVGGIHLHYLLWQRKARRAIDALTDPIDLAHHVTYGSLQFGSALHNLDCPIFFGPVGGGQTTHPVFLPLMGKGRYLEHIRNAVIFVFLRWNTLFKGTMRKATVIYCSNRETRDLAIKYVPAGEQEKVKLVFDVAIGDEYLGAAPRSVPPHGKLRLIYVGRLMPRKGIEFLLNVALQLKNDPVTLTIVGDGPLKPLVQDFIRDHALEDTIRYEGHQDQKRIRDYYHQSDLLLFLSYRDSVGMQLIEALSQGVPVVAFDQFGAGLMINANTGIKIPVTGTIEEMQARVAAEVRALAGDRRRLAEMSDNAIVYAQEFSWEKRMETFLQDIKPLLKYEDADLRLERV